MLKKTLGFLAIVALTGCAMSSKQGLTGFVYSDMTTGESATSNPAGTKMGEACANSILGWVAMGDASVEAARKNGGISAISTVDTKTTDILGLYATACTVVHGK